MHNFQNSKFILLNYIKNLKTSPIARAGMLLTVSNVATGVFGYAYQILMGRMLTAQEFALFSTLMALIMFIGAPLNATFMIVSRRVSDLVLHDQTHKLNQFYSCSQVFVLTFGLVLCIICYIYSSFLLGLIKTATEFDIFLFCAIVTLSAGCIINSAYFQGRKQFGYLSVASIAPVVSKILISLVVLLLGYGLIGVLWAIFLSYLIVYFWGFAKNIIKKNSDYDSTAESPTYFKLNNILPVLVANVAFGVMTQLDMVLVNFFFTPDLAGVYAAASVLGKAILYLPSGFVLALFPYVADNHAKNLDSSRILKDAIILTVVLSGMAAIVYYFLGGFIIQTLFGSKYYGAGDLLRWYGFAILPLALVMVAEHFLIAKGRVVFAWLFLVVAPIQLLLVIYWHEKLFDVLLAMGLCGAAVFFLGYSLLWYEYKRTPKKLF